MTDIVLIGEAWGAEEEKERVPFVGSSGWHLTQMLNEAGIVRSDCFLTNVFNLRPRGNKIEDLCGPRELSIPGLPMLAKSLYVRAEFEPELDRLRDELLEVNPNLVVALGNTALWALLGTGGISKRRGTVVGSTHCVAGFKVLPTYHPAAVMRQWELRAVTVLDLMKAKRESLFPEVIRPFREVYIEPSLEDIKNFYENHIVGCDLLSVDIETVGTQMVCIGFAPSEKIALVVPLADPRSARGSYWPSREAEMRAMVLIKMILNDPCPKLFQNGLFDLSVLWRSYKIRVRNPFHDTMLLSHSLQPEAPKALAFLGSCFTNEASWKLMRGKNAASLKQDE